MAKYQEILDEIKELNKQFARVDERTRNIYHLDEKQEQHLVKLNDSILKHAVQISTNKAHIWWIIRVLIAAGVIGGGATGLVQWLG